VTSLAEKIVNAIIEALGLETTDNWDDEEHYETTRDELLIVVEKILTIDRQGR
jgi:hypothetical protein